MEGSVRNRGGRESVCLFACDVVWALLVGEERRVKKTEEEKRPKT